MARPHFRRLNLLAISLALLLGLVIAAPAHAATGIEVAEAQRILTKFSIPVGPVDGIWGPRTAQGMCTFRLLAGLPVSRGGITANDLATLRRYHAAYASLGSIPAPARHGRGTYLLATRTCQTMFYASNGHYVRALRISTGKPGYATPTGNYVLGATRPGGLFTTRFGRTRARLRR